MRGPCVAYVWLVLNKSGGLSAIVTLPTFHRQLPVRGSGWRRDLSVAHSYLIFQAFMSRLALSFHFKAGSSCRALPSIFISATALMLSVVCLFYVLELLCTPISDHVPNESVAVVINVVQVEQQCVGRRQRYRITNTRCRCVNSNVNIKYDVPNSRCSCIFNLIIGRCCDSIHGNTYK